MQKLLLLPLVYLSLYGAEVQYNIDTLVEKALIASPDLNISQSSFKISQERSSEATSDYLPQVDLYGGIGFVGVTSSVQSGRGELISGKITGSQLIYDFGKTGGNMDFYSEESNATFATYNQDVANKVKDVKNDYYDLLRKHHLIKVYKENVLLTEQQHTRAERYFEAGIKTKIDVIDAKVRLIEANIDLENGKFDLKLAYVTLDKTIGNLDKTIEGNIYIPDVNLTSGLYKTLPQEAHTPMELVQYAFKHRQELKSFKHKIKSAQGKIDQESGDYFPGLYVGGDYTYNDVSEELQLFVPEKQWNANINLKWNLFGGMRTVAKTEQAKLSLLQQHASFDDAKLRIRQETSNAFIILRKTDSNVELSEELVIAAREKFDQAQQRYEHGLSDFIELQQARQDYINAQSDLVSNFYEYYIAMASLDRAIGR